MPTSAMPTPVMPTTPIPVYFFGTCLADAVYTDAGIAAVDLLERHGARVVYPLDQGCCGQPAWNAGRTEEAREVAWRQIELFSDQDWPVVVPSGSCAAMMRLHYPRLFDGDPRYFRALTFADRVFEFAEFLADVLGARLVDTGPSERVAWHSSCHALRETGGVAAAKSLLRQLARVELVDLAHEHECCGFGGLFSVKRPEISAAMVLDKLADIRATGATTVLAGDCGCLMNIATTARKQGHALRALHLAEFLRERTSHA